MLLNKSLIELKKQGMDITEIDFKDYLFITNKTNLYKWVKYIACDYGDADQVIKCFRIFDILKWNSEYIDCIFSMKTIFNKFLKFYLKGSKYEAATYGQIMDNYDDIFNEREYNNFCIRNGIDFSLVEKIFELIDVFAKYTHTIGNYMPCPDNMYNAIKGYGKGYKYFQDRIEKVWKYLYSDKNISFKEFNDKKQIYKCWFDKVNKSLYIDEIIKNESKLLLFDWIDKNGCFVKEMTNEKHLNDYLKYLELVINLIKNRSKLIEKLL